MKKEDYDWIRVPEWSADSISTLNQLSKLIVKLQKKYGKNALVDFDAGANSVLVLIRPSKRIKTD